MKNLFVYYNKVQSSCNHARKANYIRRHQALIRSVQIFQSLAHIPALPIAVKS